MSRWDYEAAQRVRDLDPPFASLIMAALHKADSTNAAIIRSAWPEIAAETQARHDAPAGYLYPERLPQGSWWCDECRQARGPGWPVYRRDETGTVLICSPGCAERRIDEALR